MPAPGVVFIGLDAVLARLGGLTQEAKVAIDLAFRYAVNQGIESAIMRCPVGEKAFERDGETHPGFLKSQNDVVPVGWSGTRYEVDMVNNAPYAYFVNNGTRYMSAQPFFTRGVERAKVELNLQLQALMSGGGMSGGGGAIALATGEMSTLSDISITGSSSVVADTGLTG
jgi:HK97 gp10 family phage protein